MACDKRGLKTASETNDMHYANFDVKKEWPHLFADFKIVDFAAHDIDAEKVYVVTNNPEDIAFIESLLPDELYLSMNMGYFAMVMHKDATKSRAISELAKIWGIDPSEIVSFGDDFNDIDMLIYAGFGVAMANAIGEAKTAADYVCGSNDEDGAARWLEENVLQ
jgi:hypothetical protein